MISHMDVRGRALALFLVSSGVRIGEALLIQINDVNFGSEPPEVTVRAEITKTKIQRYTFISKEATAAIMEWLKVREKYITAATNKNAGLIQAGYGKKVKRPARDTRLFPFSDQVVSQIWETALKNSGLYSVDSSTGRRQIHPHQLRKFFRSYLGLSMPVDMVEVLMGHSGYLTSAYRRIPKKEIAEAYLQNEYRVMIQVPRELKEMESEFRTRMNTHSEIIENVVKENIHLKNEVAGMKDDLAELLKIMKDRE